MLELFTYIDPKSFQSAWFWIMLCVSWSLVCVRTLSVPYDMLVRALHGDAQAMEDCETLARISTRRKANFYRKNGGLWIGIMFFILATSATFGFVYNYELAQGLFLFLMPMILLWLLGMRVALKINDQGLTGELLCRALLRLRFVTQVLGIVAISIAMVMMIINIAMQTVYWF